MGVGWFLSFRGPESLLIMALCFPVGLMLTMMGGYLADRYAGPLAHHDALVRALKGLDKRHRLLQYVLPASHVLFGPGGLTAVVVRAQGDRVTYQNGRWKHHQRGRLLRLFRRLAGQEVLGVPHLEAERQVHKLECWLDRHIPGVQVPVQAVIVFINPEVTLDLDDPPVPTFRGKKAKAWLRGAGALEPLPDDVQSQLAEALGVD
jgi:hypothetical protein